MMKPQKAYIIKIDNPISEEYAQSAKKSCEEINFPYETYTGVSEMDGYDAWALTELSIPKYDRIKRGKINKASCATVSHVLVWLKMIRDNVKCAIILEHDAILLQRPNIVIPDNMIVAMGYKTTTPEKYDHISAGKPKEILDCDYHEGAHAYAITNKTAKMLLDELEERGTLGAVDNAYFLRGRKTKVPLGIASPPPAIGWLRQSTIWGKSANRNAPFIDSFKEHWNG